MFKLIHINRVRAVHVPTWAHRVFNLDLRFNFSFGGVIFQLRFFVSYFQLGFQAEGRKVEGVTGSRDIEPERTVIREAKSWSHKRCTYENTRLPNLKTWPLARVPNTG